MKVVRLSALRIDLLYRQEIFLVLISVRMQYTFVTHYYYYYYYRMVRIEMVRG